MSGFVICRSEIQPRKKHACLGQQGHGRDFHVAEVAAQEIGGLSNVLQDACVHFEHLHR
jgi:hypothetical protein